MENRDEMNVVKNHPSLTTGELTMLGWQYRFNGGFFTALWKAISVADLGNLANLKKGFPSEVQAYEDYAHTGAWNKKVHRILTEHDSKTNQQKGN
jgi:hypothetical protein